MATAVELYIKTLPTLEGIVKHKDLKNIKTLPYGIVNDSDKNPTATTRNKKAAKSLGYNLNDLTIDQAKEVATKISNDIDKEVSENSKIGKEYADLSDNLKILVIDAHFNTGEVFKKLIKASTKYMSDKNEDTLYNVIRESRRVSKGKPVEGLDNRVGKLATMVGIISNPNDVAKYGLDKVDVLPGDVKLAQKFAEQGPAMSETDRMLLEARTPDPEREVDPGDEENPRTQLDLPPQAITPRERNLTGVAPEPLSRSTLEQTDKMLEEGDDPLSDAMGPRLITQQTSGIDLSSDEDTPTGDGIFTKFFSSLGDVSDEDEVFEADELNLKEGGSVEEVDFVEEKSEKNDPPPGATPEEVADDIPVNLSEGEYVLPANVVRYIGLERIMGMHKGVLHEIQQMEDLGMIQNVDENGHVEDDDDEMTFIEPKNEMMHETLIIAGKPKDGMMCPPKFAEGGNINRNVDIGDLRENIAIKRGVDTELETYYDDALGLITYSKDGEPLAVMKRTFLEEETDSSSEDANDGVDQFGVDMSEQETADLEAGMSDVDTGMQDEEAEVSDPAETGAAEAEAEAEAEAAEAAEAGAGSETGAAAMGGLMKRKGYAEGGPVNYNIAGVGQVGGNLTQGAMNEITEALPKPKTFEEIKQSVSGFEFPELSTAGTDPDGENYYGRKLEGNNLLRRKEEIDQVYKAEEPRENAYESDKEVRDLLKIAGVDSDNFIDVMDQFKQGANDLLGQGPGVLNEQLKNGLAALSDKRRILKKGITPEDIPEGATNRDMLKKIYFNEIDNFGDLDPNNYEPNQQLDEILNVDPDNFVEGARESYKEAIRSYDLDGPADATKIRHVTDTLTGDLGFGPTRKKEVSTSGIMGNKTYVEGVGYVKAA